MGLLLHCLVCLIGVRSCRPLSAFCMVEGTAGKLVLHAGTMKFTTWNEDAISICIILPV